MTLKQQIITLKENWLITLLVLILIGFFAFSGSTPMLGKTIGNTEMLESAAYRGGYYPQTDFAPEVEGRKIIKTASLSTEVEKNTFSSAEQKLKAIITSTDSYILNENVNKYGTKKKTYYSGTYQIKVDTRKYDSIITQLKEIGEVKSFSENARDVTGSYTNTEIEIEAEKSRLERYQEMYRQAELISDKITLNDQIFNQEKRIKYLEDSLKKIDKQIEYSSITVSIREKQSEYANIAFVKFSKLIKNLVGSINSLFSLVFILFPYAIALLIIWFIVRIFKKR